MEKERLNRSRLILTRVWAVPIIAALSMAASKTVFCAGTYPSKPIKIISPSGPGGASDISARLFANVLTKRWKQSVVVINKPGASGLIGTEALKNSPANGYTLGMAFSSSHASAPHIFKKLPYDPINDFQCIGLIGTSGSIALVPVNSPFKSMNDLIAYAKGNPGKVLFGHFNNLSLVNAALFAERANIQLVAVAYKEIGNAITDLIGSEIHLMFVDYPSAQAQLSSGRLIPIAVTERKRHPLLPEVPALAESLPGFELTGYMAVTVPRGTPEDIVDKLSQALRDAHADPAFIAPLEKTGATLVSSTPEECRTFMVNQIERWRQYVKAAKIEPQ